jgi:microcystin-dependent protein
MATNNSVNMGIQENADGGEIQLGVIKRILRWLGSTIILTGSGSNVYTFPNQSGTVALMELVYPIGSVVTLGVSTNPATLFGIGTWAAIAGRVIVGIDATQTEFDTLSETGGAKTHTLITSEMPVHTHIQDAHNHTQNSHPHTILARQNSTAGTEARVMNSTAGVGGANSTPDTSAATATNIAATATNQNAGSGGTHNNLQPYIVKYVWQRTA